MRPLIIGRIPETNNIGGVGIFVSRLFASSAYLKKNEYTFYSTKYNRPFQLVKSIFRSSFVHFNGSNPLAMFLVSMICFVFNKKLILSIHGEVGLAKGISKKLEEFAIKLAHTPVVGEGSKLVSIKLNACTEVSSAFIPPISTSDKAIDDVVKPLNGKKIFCTNANSYSFDSHGREIYGITSLVTYFENRDDHTLIVVDSSKQYSNFYKGSNFKNVIFITDDVDFCYLIQKSFCFIRFTSTDGDSVSIKESLFFNVPVIASDCITRPKSCILCNFANVSSLDDAIKSVENDGFKNCQVESAAIFYDNLYQRISNSI